jgi:outer membrane protein TolC
MKEVESAVRNGVVLASNADILKAELLKVEQKIDEIDITEEAALKSLALLIGQDIQEGVILEMPAPEVKMDQGPQERLEYGLFELQQQKMDALKKVSGTSLMPKFQAFGQAGIGRPAFDMLNDDFDDYYIIGLRMNWTFWNWNKTRNQKQVLALNQEIIASKRDVFDQNLSIDLENKRAEVRKYEQIIQKDQQILNLRSKIVQEYASRLNNGVITATEYLTELNAESEAKLNINIHKINLVQAKFQYLSTIGQL